MARVNRMFLAVAIFIPMSILNADGLPSPDSLTMNVVNHDDPGSITDAEKPDAGVRLAGNPNTSSGNDRTPGGGGIKTNPREKGGSEKDNDGREKSDDGREKDDDSREKDDDSREKDDDNDSRERDDDNDSHERDNDSHEKDDGREKGKKEKSD